MDRANDEASGIYQGRQLSPLMASRVALPGHRMENWDTYDPFKERGPGKFRALKLPHTQVLSLIRILYNKRFRLVGKENDLKYSIMVGQRCVRFCTNCCKTFVTLQWRNNGRDSVSNHLPYDCLLNRLFRRRSTKTSKLRVTGLCAGNSPGIGEFPAQMTSDAENVSIWWRHHEFL